MKVALVTGAGRGLGKGFAEHLADSGYFVYAGVRDLSEKMTAENPNIRFLTMDVQNDGSIGQAIELIGHEQGKIDLLVNNAGVNKDTATSGHKELATVLGSLDRRTLLKMFDINAVSPLMVIKQAVRLMNGRQAFIINISSDRAAFGNALNDTNANYGYKASKTALNMLTKNLVFDLPKSVSVVAVHPGNVHSDMNPGGSLEPRQAAQRIIQIINNWDPRLNGSFVHNDGSAYDG